MSQAILKNSAQQDIDLVLRNNMELVDFENEDYLSLDYLYENCEVILKSIHNKKSFLCEVMLMNMCCQICAERKRALACY